MLRFVWRRILREFFGAPDAFDRKCGVEIRRTVGRGRISPSGDDITYEADDLKTLRAEVASVPRVIMKSDDPGGVRAVPLRA